MKQRVSYKLDKLREMLPNFKLEAFRVLHDSEDESRFDTEYRFYSREDIKQIRMYHGWGTSTTVEYDDGTLEHLYGDNIIIQGKKLVRVTNNQVISPRVLIGGNYVESNEELNKWLKNQGITDEQLDAISEQTTIYEVIEYTGVPTPSKSPIGNCWGYSNENLKLDEREIIKVLNSIDDELLREKIKCILNARVFKRRY